MDEYTQQALSILGLNTSTLSDKEIFEIVRAQFPGVIPQTLGKFYQDTKESIIKANSEIWKNVLNDSTFWAKVSTLAAKLRALDDTPPPLPAISAPAPLFGPRPTGQGVLDADDPDSISADASTDEVIQCRVCGQRLKMITSAHLRHHSLTRQQYEEMFPGAPLVAPALSEIRRQAAFKTRLWTASPTGGAGNDKMVQGPESADPISDAPLSYCQTPETETNEAQTDQSE